MTDWEYCVSFLKINTHIIYFGYKIRTDSNILWNGAKPFRLFECSNLLLVYLVNVNIILIILD